MVPVWNELMWLALCPVPLLCRAVRGVHCGPGNFYWPVIPKIELKLDQWLFFNRPVVFNGVWLTQKRTIYFRFYFKCKSMSEEWKITVYINLKFIHYTQLQRLFWPRLTLNPLSALFKPCFCFSSFVCVYLSHIYLPKVTLPIIQYVRLLLESLPFIYWSYVCYIFIIIRPCLLHKLRNIMHTSATYYMYIIAIFLKVWIMKTNIFYHSLFAVLK